MGIFDVFSDGNEKAARDAQIAGLNDAYDKATGALNSGYGKAQGYYDQALVPFESLLERGNKGYDTYLDATGVNGAEGVARAGDIFKSLPGYSGGLNTGVDLLERRAAARGDLGGGNTSADTIKFASDYDSGKFQNFLTSLAPNIGVATGATSGTAGVYGQKGALEADLGSKTAAYGWQQGTGIGNANADFEKSKDQSGANFWGALLGGATLGAKALGVGGFGLPSGGGVASTVSYGGQSWPMYT